MPLEGYITTDGPYTGLSKEQLLQCAYRPVWVRIRTILLVAYWISWLGMLAGAIALVVLTPKCQVPEPLQWWQLAPAYQIYTLSYKDGSQPPDGVGDIQGIESKLDYIKDLGVGAVWLSPFYKSPMKDFGYDIEDFRAIDPIFGTMDDFHSLSKAMKQRDLKLILDFVPNHSSDQHIWFQKSIKKEEPYTDYYVWVDAKGFDEDGKPIPPNNWISVFCGSAWEWNEERKQFYLHQFLKQQPDLNFRNRLVLKEMKDILQFWLDQGIDGFRIDAAPHLFEDELLRDEPIDNEDAPEYQQLDHIYTYNLPEVLDVLREFRILLDENSKNDTKVMMVEAYLPVEKVMSYYGNKSTPIANFPFNFEFISSVKGNTTAAEVYDIIKTWMDYLPAGAWSNWVTGNHDNPRVATKFGPELVDAINMMIMLLPGTPVTYYGEEIGMENAEITYNNTKDPYGINSGPKHYKLFSRDPARTPMQWNAGINAGFSTANETWLPVNPNYITLNVEAQLDAEWSHLKVYKMLVATRKMEAVMTGDLQLQFLKDTVLVYTRIKEGFPGYMVVTNFADDVVTVDLTTINHIPESSSVHIFSTTYAPYFNFKQRISNSQLQLPGKGGLVLTFVPDIQDSKEPIPL